MNEPPLQIVATMMSRPVNCVRPETPLSEALERMQRERISSLVVSDGDKPLGVITERGIVQLIGSPRLPATCGEAMSQPVRTIAASADYCEAYHLFSLHGLRHLLVVDDKGKAVGMLTEGDIMRHLGMEYFLNLRDVGAAMTRAVVTLPPGAPLSEALMVMQARRISCVVVSEGDKPIGIVTERDMVAFPACGRHADEVLLRDAMSAPVHTIEPGRPLYEAVRAMEMQRIRRLVVVDANGRLAGILTRHDVIKGLEGRYLKLLQSVVETQRRELAASRRALSARALPQSIVDSAEETLILATDLDGEIIFCNPAAEGILGLPRDSLLGRPLGELHEAMGMAAPDIAALIAQVGGANSHRTLVLPRRGRHLEVAVSALRGEACAGDDGSDGERRGPLRGLLLVGHDTTDWVQAQQLLRESEEKLRALFDQAFQLAALLALDGTVLDANYTALQIVGLTRDQIFGRPFWLLPCWAHSPALQDRLRQAIHGAAHGHTSRFDAVAAAGSAAPEQTRQLDLAVKPMRDALGRTVRLIVEGRDISDLRRAEEELRLAAKVFDASREGMVITDPHGDILSVNLAFTAITGYPRDEVVGRNPRLLASGRHDAGFYRAMWQSLNETGQWRGEIWNRRRDGAIYPQWLEIAAVYDADGRVTHYIGLLADLSERKAFEERLEYLAWHDPLTGLPNRALLRDRLEQAAAQAQRQGGQVAMLSIDLDLFKHINDTLGHTVGDALLVRCGERIAGVLRASDTVARFAADQYFVVLPGVQQAGAVQVAAQKILDALREPTTVDGAAGPLAVTASIGIALYPIDGADFETLIRNAEAAMYDAKQAGRDTARFFDPTINRRSREQLKMQAELRRALAEGEFLLYYQPQVELASGRITGLEALLRWQDPQRGLISPAQFIPLAEESGLIQPIGAWALRTACRQTRRWQLAGLPPLTMAVNLSAVQFRRGDLFATVTAALEEAGLDPAWLELELTESTLMQESERASSLMRELKTLGLQLAIDDFGTGYSSLAYLRRFAVDTLKIDRSFIGDLESDPDAAAIVRAIVQMAHSLKLTVVAEGVENERQAHLLKLAHCDELQGYFFARPLPVDEIETLLRRQPHD